MGLASLGFQEPFLGTQFPKVTWPSQCSLSNFPLPIKFPSIALNLQPLAWVLLLNSGISGVTGTDIF